MKLLQLFCNFFDCIRFLIFEILLLCLKKAIFPSRSSCLCIFSLVLFNMFAFDCQGADVFLEKLIVTLIIVLLSYLLCKFVNFLFYPQKSYLLVSSALSNEEPFDVYWLDVLTTLDAAFWLILPLTKLILESSPVSPSNTFFNVSASALCNTFSSMERLPSFCLCDTNALQCLFVPGRNIL